jgi:hypothetical protein
MKKISTLFKKDPNDLGKVINEINPENAWVFEDGVKATRKFDGTACAIIEGQLYKRYDVKKGKEVPVGAIPCQEPDAITGHWPHWVKCDRNNPGDKYHFEGFERYFTVGGILRLLKDNLFDGTYELCGPKIQGNPEKLDFHILFLHGNHHISIDDFGFDFIKEYLKFKDIEGIVFHHPDGRMCKIRKTDFGIKR